jgi:hypothetical protein
MIKEHDRAILTTDLPEHRLKTGDVGTVVHVYQADKAYEVEFFTLDGKTLDVVTVEASQVRPVGEKEIMHARSVQ